MGVLTEQTTRLCLEIGALREARQALLAEMRRATQSRRAAVSEILTRFSEAQAEASRRMKTDLASSLHRLRGRVDGLRKEVTADIVGIRQAWMGTAPARPAAVRIEITPGVKTPAEGIEAVEEKPHVEPAAEPEREVVEEVPEAAEEIKEAGTGEGEPGVAAKMEGKAPKRRRKH